MRTYAYALSAMLALQGVALAVDAAPKPAAFAPARTFSLRGTVVSIDPVGNTLVVKGKNGGEKTFQVPATAMITEGKKTAALANIAAGTKVVVKYTEGYGTKTAAIIKVLPAAASAKPMAAHASVAK